MQLVSRWSWRISPCRLCHDFSILSKLGLKLRDSMCDRQVVWSLWHWALISINGAHHTYLSICWKENHIYLCSKHHLLCLSFEQSLHFDASCGLCCCLLFSVEAGPFHSSHRWRFIKFWQKTRFPNFVFSLKPHCQVFRLFLLIDETMSCRVAIAIKFRLYGGGAGLGWAVQNITSNLPIKIQKESQDFVRREWRPIIN